MKKAISVIIILLLTGNINVHAQSVAINTDGSTADASAALDIKSTERGMLIPRMVKAEKDAIASPANGLLIYQTDNTPGFYFYNGSSWKNIGSSALPTGAIVLSETKHDPLIEAAGFTYSGYMENNVNITEEVPATIPANTWYPLNQSEPDNFSAPDVDSLPVFWDGANALIVSAQILYSYNPVTDKYTSYQLSNPVSDSAFIDATFTFTGTEVLVFNYTGGHRLTIAGKSWSDMSATNAPSPRKNHSAVWTGSKLLIWGGKLTYSSSCFDDGGIYDPATNTWTPISSGGILTGKRESHSAIWDGTEMIVWGGRKHVPKFVTTPYCTNFLLDSLVNFSGGFKYNPVTNAYSLIAPSGLEGRINHSAVWTGTEMVIWGGDSYLNGVGYDSRDVYDEIFGYITHYFCTTIEKGHYYYSTGAKYNPVTNTWTALTVPTQLNTSTNIPGLWTGSKIIYLPFVQWKISGSYVWGNTTIYTYAAPDTYYFPSYTVSSNSWDITNVSYFNGILSKLYPGWKNIIWAGDKILVFNKLAGQKLKGYGYSTTPVNLIQGQTGVPKRFYLYKKN